MPYGLYCNGRFDRFFKRYRQAILFNKNLLISGTGGFFVSAYISQIHLEHYADKLANSVTALVVEYAVYIPLFVLLFYMDNRSRYTDPATGKRNYKVIKDDVKRLFATFSVAEVVFSVTRFVGQYQLLQVGMQAYQASMIGSMLAWVAFFIAINVMAKLVKLFR
ncbi:MAG: hypothetical protein RMJ59_02855 [Candidatus Nitrosocaldus sp.]|nr:hypothetical protein [Candidatus Nitrosocaldus sp.]MCS7141449.1 hypothetical protein [Candidatus Nitrosocaldus sp.]MDW7999655.1 hypothetical protein [Candidatus Nitrosocaldus sp.]MDW8275309.1 hypothetical protein [Candidatus Nitrosocaldus sp.]